MIIYINIYNIPNNYTEVQTYLMHLNIFRLAVNNTIKPPPSTNRNIFLILFFNVKLQSILILFYCTNI